MINGVLLDVDGTLVLSNDAHAHAWVGAFKRHGYDVSFESVRPLIGMGGDKLIPKLLPGLNSESGNGKVISEFRSKLFLEKYAPGLQPSPGSRAFVAYLIKSNYRVMVASSAKLQELKVLLMAAKVDDLLPEATTSDDADNSKPDPDIIHAALEKINLPPDHTVMVGDTPYDIEAAGRAGVQVIAVRCGGWAEHQLEGAIAIYKDPADILNQFSSSPFGVKTGNQPI